MGPLTDFVRGRKLNAGDAHNGLRAGVREIKQTLRGWRKPEDSKEGDSVQSPLHQLDQTVVEFTADNAIPLLRVSLGIVYIWFGALKIAGASPVADMVAETAFLIPKRMFVRLVGCLELVVGLGLLFRAALHLTLVLFFFQLMGTFMILFARPQRIFQSYNPFLLTKEGEFLLKNLILLSAGLAVGSTADRQDEEIRDSRGETAD